MKLVVLCRHLHKGAVQDVKWNANGNWMITASRDNLIKVLDIRAMKEMYVLRGHRRDVNSKSMLPSEKVVIKCFSFGVASSS